MLFFFLLLLFFVQAEDGIRDLVRSRGLGDVYKRQVDILVVVSQPLPDLVKHEIGRSLLILSEMNPGNGIEMSVLTLKCLQNFQHPAPVSYTHLTLPTSDLV